MSYLCTEVKNDPGVPLVYLGFAIVMPATLLSLIPFSQVWATAEPDESDQVVQTLWTHLKKICKQMYWQNTKTNTSQWKCNMEEDWPFRQTGQQEEKEKAQRLQEHNDAAERRKIMSGYGDGSG